MENYVVRSIDASEAQDVVDFKNLHYHNQTPLEMAVGGVFKSDNTDMIIDAIRNGFVLKVVELDSSIMVGLVIGHRTDPPSADQSSSVKNISEISKLLVFVEEKAKIFEKYENKRRVRFRSLCAHSERRGCGIGKLLFEAGIAEAKRKNYELLTVNCPNAYSARIAAGLKLELVTTVKFEDYNNHAGRKVFRPVEPHTVIETYALQL